MNVYFLFQKALMRDLIPNKTNKSVISAALAATFSARRKWIRVSKPTCTDILDEYKHLSSFQGAMVRLFSYLSK